MRTLWLRLGNAAFWICWPALWLYLRVNPPRTRVLVVADGKVLLVKSWLGAGEWSLPGGGLHQHELPAAGAVRELEEETGIVVGVSGVQQLSKGWSQRYGLRYRYISFVAPIAEQQPVKRQFIEIVDSVWVSPEKALAMCPHAELSEALAAWKKA